MISIIIPTYNRAYIIGRTLDSIIQQSYPDWECIIVDDFSTDNTESIVTIFQNKDNRIKFIRNNRSKGAQGARNTGIMESKGEWVVLFDSDNVMHPDFLQKCTDALGRFECDVVNTWSNIIDVNTNNRIGTFSWVNIGFIHEKLLTRKCYVDNSSTIIRKTLLQEIGLLSEDCPAFQEWDTHIRMSSFAKYYTIKEYLIDYYSGALDAISSSSIKDIKGYLYILTKFKKEWIQKRPLHFLKLLSILKNKIKEIGAPYDYMRQYKVLVGNFKLIVDAMAFYMRCKNRFKHC